ncbi:DNA polymerase IV [Emticicia sp. BO119]|uniref:DNA polymerase IV n=1 Tax=Emticicia sp. BO119 TaxID=2757768 RepID=UPI0015F0D4B5|nr:DNA polymerase IV [Emticicia sp. BO119]MBA4852524.1 DNA polymerase IV [Emticicia sp. BO119]
MEKAIVHYDLDSFFVSVERLKNSSLIGKPVVVGGSSERGVVASASYEARKFGIHSAMSSQLAKRLCPDAIFVKGDHESYTKYSNAVTEIISESVPVLEKASIDEFYCDFTGMEKFFGCYKWAKEIKTRISKETHLDITFGLSTSKTVSKVATNEAKPNGKLQVLTGCERSFLNPLSINKLPMIGDTTAKTLRTMGIQNIGTLAAMPMKLLEAVFGKHGKLFWERANGIDDTPIVPYHDQKSFSKEMTFDKDTTDTVKLKSILVFMVESLTFDLRQQVKCAGTITVKIRYSNFDTYTRQTHVFYTSDDQIIIEKVMDLFDNLYDKRLLIRLIGVRLSKLVQGYSQINLFDNSSRLASLHQAMDKVKLKHGEKIVGRANGMQVSKPPLNKTKSLALTQ